MSSNTSTRSSVDGLRYTSTLPTLSPMPGSPGSEKVQPGADMNKSNMGQNGNEGNYQDGDDEEDMDLKARALTKLLKTSSVRPSV